MKKFICVISVILSLLSLTSCSSDGFRDGIACKDVGSSITDTLDDGKEYLEYDENHRKLYFEDSEHYDDCYLAYSSDTGDINEFGVFHAPDSEHAEDIYEDCMDYVEDLKENSRSFIASYAPEEIPKLDGATVRRYGNYVVYTVLPDKKTNDIFSKIEESLKKD